MNGFRFKPSLEAFRANKAIKALKGDEKESSPIFLATVTYLLVEHRPSLTRLSREKALYIVHQNSPSCFKNPSKPFRNHFLEKHEKTK